MARGTRKVIEPDSGDASTASGATEDAGQLSGNSGVEGGVGNGASGVDGVAGGVAQDADAASGPAKAKRGRPALSEAEKAARKAARDRSAGTEAPARGIPLKAKDIVGQVQGLHAMFAAITKQPIWMIGDDEAMRLAMALENMSRHYSIPISEPKLAIIALIGAAGSIYLPRLFLLAQSRKQMAAAPTMAATADDPSNVVQEGVMKFG